MNKKYFFSIIFFVILSFLITSCTTSQVIKEKDEVIKVGVILPLTGLGAKMGQDVRNAIDLAAKEINEEGELLVNIIYEDAPLGLQTAVTAMDKIVHVDEAPFVIVALDSSSVLAIRPIAEESQVLLLTPSGSAPQITKEGGFIFRTTISDTFEGKLMAEFAVKNLGIKRIAVIFSNNDYGISLKDFFQQEVEKHGGEIVAQETYNPLTAVDYRTQLTKIKSKQPDAIYIIATLKESGLILKETKELGIDAQILTTRTFDDPEILELAGDASEGVIFVAFESIRTNEFISNYKQEFGQEPGMYSSRAYDALKLIVESAKKCDNPNDTLCVKNQLYKIKNYQGASGLITFDKKGDIYKPLIFKTVKNGEFVIYQGE